MLRINILFHCIATLALVGCSARTTHLEALNLNELEISSPPINSYIDGTWSVHHILNEKEHTLYDFVTFKNRMIINQTVSANTDLFFTQDKAKFIYQFDYLDIMGEYNSPKLFYDQDGKSRRAFFTTTTNYAFCFSLYLVSVDTLKCVPFTGTSYIKNGVAMDLESGEILLRSLNPQPGRADWLQAQLGTNESLDTESKLNAYKSIDSDLVRMDLSELMSLVNGVNDQKITLKALKQVATILSESKEYRKAKTISEANPEIMQFLDKELAILISGPASLSIFNLINLSETIPSQELIIKLASLEETYDGLDDIGVSDLVLLGMPHELANYIFVHNEQVIQSQALERQKQLLLARQKQIARDQHIYQLAEAKRQKELTRKQLIRKKEKQDSAEMVSAFKFIGGMVAGTAAGLEAKHSGYSEHAQNNIALDAMLPFLDEEDRRNIQMNRKYYDQFASATEMFEQQTSEVNASLSELNQKQAQLKQQRQSIAQRNVFDMKGYPDLSSCQMDDIQLKSMCSTANLYYIAYKKALQDGYSSTEADKNWQAHIRSAEQTIMFYERTRAAMVRQEDQPVKDVSSQSPSSKKTSRPVLDCQGREVKPGAKAICK